MIIGDLNAEVGSRKDVSQYGIIVNLWTSRKEQDREALSRIMY